MGALDLRRISNPKFLRQLTPSLLVAFLRPYEAYLAKHQIALPPKVNETPHHLPGDADPMQSTELDVEQMRIDEEQAVAAAIDYKKLGSLLARTDERAPAALIDAFYYVSSLVRPRVAADVEEEIHRLHTSDPALLSTLNYCMDSPADLAVRLYLHDPKLAVRLQTLYCGYNPTSYQYFSRSPVAGGPSRHGPNLAQLPALEAALATGLAKRLRGRSLRVIPIESPDGSDVRFYVQRGELFRREATLVGGQPASVAYRPLQYDVVGYNHVQQALRVHTTCGPWLTELYLKAFGTHLFDDPFCFSAAPRFTLERLREGPSCLRYFNTPVVNRVRLVELELHQGGTRGGSNRLKSPDVYRLLNDTHTELSAKWDLVRAKFEVAVVGRDRDVVVTVEPPNTAQFSADDDGMSAAWLSERGFVFNPSK